MEEVGRVAGTASCASWARAAVGEDDGWVGWAACWAGGDARAVESTAAGWARPSILFFFVLFLFLFCFPYFFYIFCFTNPNHFKQISRIL